MEIFSRYFSVIDIGDHLAAFNFMSTEEQRYGDTPFFNFTCLNGWLDSLSIPSANSKSKITLLWDCSKPKRAPKSYSGKRQLHFSCGMNFANFQKNSMSLDYSASSITYDWRRESEKIQSEGFWKPTMYTYCFLLLHWLFKPRSWFIFLYLWSIENTWW